MTRNLKNFAIFFKALLAPTLARTVHVHSAFFIPVHLNAMAIWNTQIFTVAILFVFDKYCPIIDSM